MIRALFLFLLAFTLIRVSAQTTPAGSARQLENFDRSWKFLRGDAVGADQPTFDDSTWRAVDLPHDFSLEGAPATGSSAVPASPFNKFSKAGGDGGYLAGGVAWYRKVFTVPASSNGKRVTLLFDGAYSNADIYLNGQKLGNHPYGFTSFYYDLTPTLKVGAQNVVSVRLQVDQPCCRWYSGAGLYRHVWLITTNPIHIAQWGDYITSPHADAAGSDVNVNTTVQNETSAPADVSITTVIQDPSGTEVGRASATESVPTNGKVALDQKIHLATAQLWSLETPLLYHSVTEVRVGDQLVDATTTPFGIRSFIFTKDKGFFLNGQHVQIQGVCDHHDLGCLGSAAYRRGLERQIEILKSFGCNALRTSHNPPSPELLELCDKMGMLVMDEAFDEWKENQNKFGYGNFFDQWSDLDLASMIDRDRNHPCIILYSIGNEILEGREGKPVAGPISQHLSAICHQEDPTRPVTSACPSPGNDWNSGLAKCLDVFGINYSIGWYGKNDPNGKNNPKPGDTGYYGQLPLVGSETSAQQDSRCEYLMSLDPQGNVKIDATSKVINQVSSYDRFHPGWGYSAETDLLALKMHLGWRANLSGRDSIILANRNLLAGLLAAPTLGLSIWPASPKTGSISTKAMVHSAYGPYSAHELELGRLRRKAHPGRRLYQCRLRGVVSKW